MSEEQEASRSLPRNQIQQQRMLQRIGQVLLSLSDRQELFCRLVEAAVYVANADAGELLLVDRDPDSVRLRAHYERGRVHAILQDRVVSDPLVWQALQTGTPTSHNGPPTLIGTVCLSNETAVTMVVPIVGRDGPVGAFRVVRLVGAPSADEAEPQVIRSGFSQSDLLQLGTFSDYAGFAIENGRLRAQIQDEIDQLAIGAIGAFLGSTLQIDSVLETILQAAMHILDAQRGYILLRDQEAGAYLPGTVHGCQLEMPLTPPQSGSERIPQLPFGADLVSLTLRENSESTETIPEGSSRPAICSSIRVSSQILGAICLERDDPSAPFEEYHQDVLTALSARAAGAIQNAYLFSQVETERQKLQAEVQSRTDFVSTVSHDLRSPLGTIQSGLGMLHEAGPLNEEQQELIEAAEREIDHLQHLTSDLLDLGRLDAGIAMELTPSDLGELVAVCLDAWQYQIGRKGHRLTVHLPEQRVRVRGDREKLRQVIDNLLSNACKYTPDGGQVSVGLAQEGEQAILWVRDSGIGIASDDQERIFDPFFRVQSGETKHIEGTGLGLTIVKTIVERHGGQVHVESQPGEGSTFAVTLPAIEP